MLSSVWTINPVNPYLIKKTTYDKFDENLHPAPFPEILTFRIFELFSSKGDVILDPFCGTGTTTAVAVKRGRRAVGYDLSEKYIEQANKRCNNKAIHFCKSSETMEELRDNSVDLCFTSPPYLQLKHYTNHPDDISLVKNPYEKYQNSIHEIYRVIKPGRIMCINVSDVPKTSSELTTFPYDIIYMAINAGFDLVNTIIWKKAIRLKSWNIQNQQIRHNHEYIWIFKKSTR
jgi:DNA modification methylase